MTMLMVWAVLSGHFVFAQHEFGERRACEVTRAFVVHQLKAENAEQISSYCLDEPAT